MKGISAGLSSFCRLAQKECDSAYGNASLSLRSAGSSRISRHMSKERSIACRRRTHSRMRTFSARGTATGAATMHVWSSCMGCALCMCRSLRHRRDSHTAAEVA